MIWYLIIVLNSAYSPVMTVVPQTDMEQCLRNIAFVRKRPKVYDAYCIPGAPAK